MKMLPLLALATASLGMSLVAGANPPPTAPPASDYYSALAAQVRAVTGQFRYYSATQLAALGFFPATTCVSGPDHGAMGIHYINQGRLDQLDGKNQLELSEPPVLIYEPQSNGSQVLVGVEYVMPLAIGPETPPSCLRRPTTPSIRTIRIRRRLRRRCPDS